MMKQRMIDLQMSNIELRNLVRQYQDREILRLHPLSGEITKYRAKPVRKLLNESKEF